MSNLRLINQTSFSAVTSATITDVFTSDFDIYKIVFTDYFQTSGSAGRARLRFTSSGSVITSSDYRHASLAIESPSSSFPEVKSNNDTYIDFVLFANGETGALSSGVTYVFNPSNSSCYTFVNWQEGHFQSSFGASTEKGIGILENLNVIDGFDIHSASGGGFNLTVKTYGIRVDT